MDDPSMTLPNALTLFEAIGVALGGLVGLKLWVDTELPRTRWTPDGRQFGEMLSYVGGTISVMWAAFTILCFAEYGLGALP